MAIATRLELLVRFRCICFTSSVSEEGFIAIAIRLELRPSSIFSRLRRTSLEFLKKVSLYSFFRLLFLRKVSLALLYVFEFLTKVSLQLLYVLNCTHHQLIPDCAGRLENF